VPLAQRLRLDENMTNFRVTISHFRFQAIDRRCNFFRRKLFLKANIQGQRLIAPAPWR